MKNIFHYVCISLITAMIVACSAAPPAQPEPEPVKAPEPPVQQIKKQESVPATKLTPAKSVQQAKKQEAPAPKTLAEQVQEPVKKAPAKIEPAAPVQTVEPVKEPVAPPVPVVETKPEPVEEPKQAPIDDAHEVIAEFEGVQITKETYNQTKTEIEKVVDKLNHITAVKDYNQWITFLSADYRQQYSQAATLKTVSEALPVKGIKLKSLKDYFTYVFVPSRQNIRVDDIRFVSATRVDVIMKQGNTSLLIYGIENIDGDWKLIPPKL